MPTLNISVVTDITTIIVETGGDGGPHGVEDSAGLTHLVSLKQGPEFSLYHAVDEELERDVVLQVLRIKANTMGTRIVLDQLLATALADFSDFEEGTAEPRFRILKLVDYMGMPCLVLPYYPQSILQAVNAQTDLPTRCNLLADAAEDLARLHASGRVHGAITPGKILIDGNKAFFNGVMTYELRQVLHPDTIPLRSDFKDDAPELIREDDPQITQATDVFRFGMVIYRIFGGVYKKDSRKSLRRRLQDHINGFFELEKPLLANEEVFSLVKEATAYHPDNRPSMVRMATNLRAIAAG